MSRAGLAPAVPSSRNHSDSEDDFDLFGDDDAESTSAEFKEQRQDRADQARRAKLAALPPPQERTCAQNRTAYFLDPAQRLQPTILPNIFSFHECETVLNSVGDYVQRQGALQTDRHEKFATTDVPVSELTQHFDDDSHVVGKTVGDVIHEWVLKRILTRMASAAGFRPQDIGLKDLFVVCYAGSEEEPTTSARKRADVPVYPIPSKQASLSLHSDGCLLSFSLLLNHHDAFEGGGTFFKGSGKTLRVGQGGLLMHDAGLERKYSPVKAVGLEK